MKKPIVKKPVAKKAPVKKTAAKTGGPSLDLGDKAAQPKVSAKPGEPNFSQLMGLGGGAPKKKSKMKSPIIVTDNAAGKKKKGDWKSRGKKLSSDQDDA